MSIYELAILGAASPTDREILSKTIAQAVAGFGLSIGNDVVLHDGASVKTRNKKAAFAAAYFGGTNPPDQDAAKEVVTASAPVIPTVAFASDFMAEIPDFLRFANGSRRRSDDPQMAGLAAAMLECVGLLRPQRRVFVSYRRVEARDAALQLHDLLSSRGFDVFLDTHDIRPGERFQDVLWHRLCDSDVMLMFDTPTYFANKWTRQEIGRACAKGIHVLRVVWPGHTSTKFTDLAETIYLEPAELKGAVGPLEEKTANGIALALENLRSRSIASRYLSMTGRFRTEVEQIRGVIEGIGAHRAIAVRLSDDSRLWAYPMVGVPTAESLNDVAEKARYADQAGKPVLIYDHVGIRDTWNAHLKWLDENISAVRAVKIAEAGWTLAAWEA
jgi:hypothetical protein